jgi:hypothetical protein
MKKYTIVYGEWLQTGSHSNTITKFDRVETDNLRELIKDDRYSCSIWFIFEGWPELEGEFRG